MQQADQEGAPGRSVAVQVAVAGGVVGFALAGVAVEMQVPAAVAVVVEVGVDALGSKPAQHRHPEPGHHQADRDVDPKAEGLAEGEAGDHRPAGHEEEHRAVPGAPQEPVLDDAAAAAFAGGEGRHRRHMVGLERVLQAGEETEGEQAGDHWALRRGPGRGRSERQMRPSKARR